MWISEAPFCQYSVEVLVSIIIGSVGRRAAAMPSVRRKTGSVETRVLNGNQFSGIEPVLVLGRGAAGHAEAVIGEHLAGAGDMAEHAVEHAPPGAVRRSCPSSRKWRRNRPLCDTPKPSACLTDLAVPDQRVGLPSARS